MSWNDERVELLKKLWAEGLSASQIAGRLGGVTRNAVIGKVHRLGLSGRATTVRVNSHRPRARLAQQAKRSAPVARRFAQSGNPTVRALYTPDIEPFAPAEEIDIPLTQRKSIQTLTASSCRWPVGDPQSPEFYFCGGSAVTGLPYCECHARRAFQPPQPRRRERESVETVRAAMGATERQSVDSEAETSDA
ncbi:MAG: GcrA family cell cycle regulator [Hyphomicrobiaceae bacterium]|nr:GcrA family cell cycle regulator [Hyphomicrobiaceae bacterium]